MAQPFLNPNIVVNEVCFLCNQDCKRKERINYPTLKGWDAFKEKSKSWSKIEIPIDDLSYNYGTLYALVENLTEEDAIKDFIKTGKCITHSSCRINFRNRLPRYQEKFPEKTQQSDVPEVQPPDDKAQETSFEIGNPRSRRSHQAKYICFVCNEVRPIDGNQFDEGGLGRCEKDTSRDKLFESEDFHLHKPTTEYLRAAAQRLQILLSGTSYDIFSQDVYYHHSCYQDFMRMNSVGTTTEIVMRKPKLTCLKASC